MELIDVTPEVGIKERMLPVNYLHRFPLYFGSPWFSSRSFFRGMFMSDQRWRSHHVAHCRVRVTITRATTFVLLYRIRLSDEPPPYISTSATPHTTPSLTASPLFWREMQCPSTAFSEHCSCSAAVSPVRRVLSREASTTAGSTGCRFNSFNQW